MTTRPQAEQGIEPLPARLRTIHIPLPCTEKACRSPHGDLDDSDPLLRGWILAGVHDGSDPVRIRWYCSPQCAATGIALTHMRLEPAS
jgi:hypothetical protein